METTTSKNLLPFLASMFASSIAVVIADNTPEANLGIVQGWRHDTAHQCIMGRTCNNEPGPICMDGPYQMYGKVIPIGDCDMILTHRP